MNKKRKKAYRAGVRAELIAMAYLMVRGHRILARRYKTPVGEIDLVVSRQNRLAFVEVKGRRAVDEALCAVTSEQQRRIKRAATHWLARQGQSQHLGQSQHQEMGFDVVAIVPWKFPRHFKDAFSHTIS